MVPRKGETLMSVRWFYKGEAEPGPSERWNQLLESGVYKIQEADSPRGPWTDAEMRDDGSVWQVKRYIRMERKDAPPMRRRDL